MKTTTIRIALITVVLFSATAAYAIDVRLTYERYTDDYNQPRIYGDADLKSTAEPPAGDWKFPTFNSKKPMYALVDFGSQKMLCVLDATKAGLDYYDRLYFDENFDKDLTNESPIDGTCRNGDAHQWNTEFPAVNTVVTTATGALQPYSFKPYAYRYVATLPNGKEGPENFRFSLRLNCGYSGRLELDGKKYAIALGDANVNGKLDDLVTFQEVPGGKGATYPIGDQIMISTDDKPTYYDSQPMANVWLLGKTLYDVTVDAAGLKLTLTPHTQATSVVRVPDDVRRMSLRADGANIGVLVFDAGNRLTLPPATYHLVSYQLMRKEECGDQWRLSASATKDTPPFTVAATGESDCSFGEPFVPSVESGMMDDSAADKGVRDVSLAFSILGKTKERVTEMARISGQKSSIAMSSRGNQLPKEPVYRIVKPDGEVVTSGSFEYG